MTTRFRIPAARRSYWLAAGLALLLILWLASGSPTPPADLEAAAPDLSVQDLKTVRTAISRAELVRPEILIQGRTEPARRVTLRAETSGRVAEVNAARGSLVEAGQQILQLDLRDLPAQLEEAKAAVRAARLQHEAAQRLSGQNLLSDAELAERFATLQQAEAHLARIQVEIANTRIRAPFAGVLEQRPVELGHFVQPGDELALILETDPVIVRGDVTERQVGHLQEGERGTARLVTGPVLEGRLRYIAAEADEATRTFPVELEVANPGGNLLAGITSQIRIAGTPEPAHFISPALLALNERGELGVKAVGNQNQVVFHPVDVVQTGTDGIWVSGLPESARLITVGQGFVLPGEQVNPVSTEETEPAAFEGVNP